MTNQRSYYTTPTFVIVTLIGLYVAVHAHSTQLYALDMYRVMQEQSIAQDTSQFLALRSIHTADPLPLVTHIETPDAVRAIYISSWVAGTPSIRKGLIDFVDSSNINAVVIDIKDSTGVISFTVNDPELKKYGTDSNRIANIQELIETLHAKNIYVIGRLTAFQDPLLSKSQPHLSFKRIDNNQTWTDRKGLSFINPNKDQAWEYLATLAEYSYAIGFDEINFDYIRYPSDGNIDNINYEIKTGESRASMMKKFYVYLDERLRSQDIPISADVFGLVTTSTDDLGIGQVFEDILPHFDFVAPMVYPSHYRAGSFGYPNPNSQPYAIVKLAMKGGVDRARAINEDPKKLRTWIQDFSLGIAYGQKEVYEQIKATYDVGLDSYMSWDPKNKYIRSAYSYSLTE